MTKSGKKLQTSIKEWQISEKSHKKWKKVIKSVEKWEKKSQRVTN